MSKPAAVMKRIMDLVLATVALVAFLPFAALIAVAIKVTSPGPILFKQVRVGRNGSEFRMYKFRTMSKGDHASETPVNDDGSLSITPGKLDLTTVGVFLRRWSLDEVPQLLNILKGEMSFVGPRPDLPFQVAEYDALVMRRLAMNPGLTGLAQISGRNSLTFAERHKLDVEYVKRWTLLLDLKILLLTGQTVMTGRGLYQESPRQIEIR